MNDEKKKDPPWASYGPEIPRPDWDLWAEMKEATLWNAVALSCDLNAASAVVTGNFVKGTIREFHRLVPAGKLETFPSAVVQEFTRRYKIAKNHGFDDNWVNLAEFGAWARGGRWPWPLPDRFPREAVEEAPPAHVDARSAARSIGETVIQAGTEIIRVPHMPARLRELLTIMREQFDDFDPDNPPKQASIAREIAHRLFAKPDGQEGDLRSENALAGLIRPDAHRERDRRLEATRQKAGPAKGTGQPDPKSR